MSLYEHVQMHETARQQRLALFQLQADDHKRAQRLQRQILRPGLQAIMRSHLEHMMGDRGFRQLIERAGKELGFRRLLQQYLLSLGIDFDTEGYFEMRLRAGQTYSKAGMPLTTYHGMMHSLAQALVARASGRQDAPELVPFILKITGLDLSLATDMYHQIEVGELRRSLQEARTQEKQQRRLASRDPLTGFFNRAGIGMRLAECVELARRDERALSVVVVDVDHFKQINDEFGHPVGDEVLRVVSSRVQTALRRGDLLSRYGGDEFLLILQHASRREAREVAERIWTRVVGQPIEIGGQTLTVGISQGVASLGHEDDDASLVTRADAAMYGAKRAGRNRIEDDQRVSGEHYHIAS